MHPRTEVDTGVVEPCSGDWFIVEVVAGRAFDETIIRFGTGLLGLVAGAALVGAFDIKARRSSCTLIRTLLDPSLAERVCFGASDNNFSFTVVTFDRFNNQARSPKRARGAIGTIRAGRHASFAIDRYQFTIGAAITDAAEQVAREYHLAAASERLHALALIAEYLVAVTRWTISDTGRAVAANRVAAVADRSRRSFALLEIAFDAHQTCGV
jgi:hypothetical protein